ncbi:hypothetical protein [Streptomyces regalis]|uniref:hypothetical protein n=1 Tax=Streptomyces regalis TaxID=68262 RepID=UPI000A9BDA3D|nr:hypothetical protein [Streptomyces regalis]
MGSAGLASPKSTNLLVAAVRRRSGGLGDPDRGLPQELVEIVGLRGGPRCSWPKW